MKSFLVTMFQSLILSFMKMIIHQTSLMFTDLSPCTQSKDSSLFKGEKKSTTHHLTLHLYKMDRLSGACYFLGTNCHIVYILYIFFNKQTKQSENKYLKNVITPSTMHMHEQQMNLIVKPHAKSKSWIVIISHS